MNENPAAKRMQKAMRTLSITNFVASAAFGASYVATDNWLYLLAALCVFASGIGIIFFSRFLTKKYFVEPEQTTS